MRQRILESLGVAGVMALVIVFVQLSPVSVAGQAPAAGPAPKTAWGHPDLQGIWLDEFTTPLERNAQYANREFFTDEERAAQDAERSGSIGRDRRRERGSQQDVAGAYNAVFNSLKPAGRRTSMVVDPPNGRVPGLTPKAQEQNRLDREFRLALLQNTETCKNKTQACNGGQYGPPSPRFAELSPAYNTERMNRHNGPEDQSLSDRCMGGQDPDYGGHRRIVQGPDSIAIATDTGQGQGYQRLVYLSGSHPPSNIRLRHGDSRGRFEGNTLIVETTNFSPKFPFRGAAENLKLVERFTRMDANTLEYSVTVTESDGLDGALDDQAGDADPVGRTESHLLRATVLRGKLRTADDVDRRAHGREAFKEGRGPDPRSQDTATGGGNNE